MTTRKFICVGLTIVTASLLLTGCGGGGSGSSAAAPEAGSPTSPTPSTTATTPGVWKGTIISTATGQASSIVALTGHDGHSVWMTTDGRVWCGQLPMSGGQFDATFDGHMHDGVHFPDGTNHGAASMMIDHHSASTTSGRYSGSGDAGTFNMSLSPIW